MSRVLVTGGCGFIGTHLVRRLLLEGCDVTVLDKRRPMSVLEGVNYITERIGSSTVNDVMLFDYLKDMDVVYHLAAEPRIQTTIDNPGLAFYDNSLATLQLLEAARHVNVPRIVFASTSSVYGPTLPGHRSVEWDEREYLNPYAVSKGTCEDWCMLYYMLYDVNVVTLRYFNVYGADQDDSQAVGKFLKLAKMGRSLTVNGDGLQTRDFTHVDDIVEGTILAGTNTENHPNIFGQIINLGSGVSYSIKELALAISGKVTYGPALKGEVNCTLASNKRAKTWLNWKPTVDVLEWVKTQL